LTVKPGRSWPELEADQISWSMVIGNERNRRPVAWYTALAMAAATPMIPISPTPLTDPHAMPLADFITQVLQILARDPDVDEVLVERVLPHRFAAEGGRSHYADFFDGITRASPTRDEKGVVFHARGTRDWPPPPRSARRRRAHSRHAGAVLGRIGGSARGGGGHGQIDHILADADGHDIIVAWPVTFVMTVGDC
jgi:hypothetical protein